MEERVVERIVGRFPRFMAAPIAFGVAAGGVFLASLVWMVVKAFCGQVFISASFALLPALFCFYVLVHVFKSIRNGVDCSLRDLVTGRYAHFCSFSLLCAGGVVVQTLLGIAAALWLSFEHIPILGPLIYLLSSWVPTLFMGLVMVLFLAQVFFLPSFCVLAAKSGAGREELISNLLEAFRWGFLIRLKLTFFGLIPLGLLLLWTWFQGLGGAFVPLELAATLIRVFVFSIFAAPCFLFLVHMVVEADRFIIWRTAHKRPL